MEINQKDSKGQRQGLWKTNYNSGKRWKQTHYLNHKAHGAHKAWGYDGILRVEINYIDDIKEGEYIFYEN